MKLKYLVISTAIMNTTFATKTVVISTRSYQSFRYSAYQSIEGGGNLKEMDLLLITITPEAFREHQDIKLGV